MLEQDLERQVLTAAALEKVGCAVEINVVPNRKTPCGAGLVPRPLELVRTPALDTLDLGLL